MNPGVYTVRGCKLINAKRIKNAEARLDDRKKLRRKILRGKKRKKTDKISEIEGELYVNVQEMFLAIYIYYDMSETEFFICFYFLSFN